MMLTGTELDNSKDEAQKEKEDGRGKWRDILIERVKKIMGPFLITPPKILCDPFGMTPPMQHIVSVHRSS